MRTEKIAGFIPAKENSNRLAKKNSKEIHGVPMFAYVAWALKTSHWVDPIYVSTDSGWIASTAEALGCIAVDRPPDLARDPAQVTDVVDNFIHTYPLNGATHFLIAQPNFPEMTNYAVDTFVGSFFLLNSEFGLREFVSTNYAGVTNGALRLLELSTYNQYAYSVYQGFEVLDLTEIHDKDDLNLVVDTPYIKDIAEDILETLSGQRD